MKYKYLQCIILKIKKKLKQDLISNKTKIIELNIYRTVLLKKIIKSHQLNLISLRHYMVILSSLITYQICQLLAPLFIRINLVNWLINIWLMKSLFLIKGLYTPEILKIKNIFIKKINETLIIWFSIKIIYEWNTIVKLMWSIWEWMASKTSYMKEKIKFFTEISNTHKTKEYI